MMTCALVRVQVCVEAGMLALRAERTEICHEDFMEVTPPCP